MQVLDVQIELLLMSFCIFFRSDRSRRDYSNTCTVIKDVSVLASSVKTGEVSAVEESYSHNNSKRCSDNEDNSDGYDGINHDYEAEDSVLANIEDNEGESVDLAPLLVGSREVNSDDERNLSAESTRPESRLES